MAPHRDASIYTIADSIVACRTTLQSRAQHFNHALLSSDLNPAVLLSKLIPKSAFVRHLVIENHKNTSKNVQKRSETYTRPGK